MRSPSRATSPVVAAAPVPSTMVPPRMTMSCMALATLRLELRAFYTPKRPPESEAPTRVSPALRQELQAVHDLVDRLAWAVDADADEVERVDRRGREDGAVVGVVGGREHRLDI